MAIIRIADQKAWKRSKYGARGSRTEDGWFASQRELNRWHDLKNLERGKLIKNLRRQVPYQLVVNGVPVTTYVADFTYHDETGFVVEDAKGFATPEYKLKRSLFEALFGFKITET